MSTITRADGSAVVEPRQDIVSTVVDDMRREFKLLLDEGVKDLTIDMKGVDMVDSLGIGLLIATHNSLTQRGGVLRLTNVNKDIVKLLGKMRLDKHFRVETA